MSDELHDPIAGFDRGEHDHPYGAQFHEAAAVLAATADQLFDEHVADLTDFETKLTALIDQIDPEAFWVAWDCVTGTLVNWAYQAGTVPSFGQLVEDHPLPVPVHLQEAMRALTEGVIPDPDDADAELWVAASLHVLWALISLVAEATGASHRQVCTHLPSFGDHPDLPHLGSDEQARWLADVANTVVSNLDMLWMTVTDALDGECASDLDEYHIEALTPYTLTEDLVLALDAAVRPTRLRGGRTMLIGPTPADLDGTFDPAALGLAVAEPLDDLADLDCDFGTDLDSALDAIIDAATSPPPVRAATEPADRLFALQHAFDFEVNGQPAFAAMVAGMPIEDPAAGEGFSEFDALLLAVTGKSYPKVYLWRIDEMEPLARRPYGTAANPMDAALERLVGRVKDSVIRQALWKLAATTGMA